MTDNQFYELLEFAFDLLKEPIEDVAGFRKTFNEFANNRRQVISAAIREKKSKGFITRTTNELALLQFKVDICDRVLKARRRKAA